MLNKNTLQDKLMREKLKVKVYEATKFANDNRIEDALIIKDSIMESHIKLSDNSYIKLYTELIYNINSYMELNNLLKEMIDKDIKLQGKVCAVIINKCDNYMQTMEIVKLFEKFNIRLTLKIYTAIISKLIIREDIIAIYNQLKLNYIVPDTRILNLIISRLEGCDEQYRFIYLRNDTKLIEDNSKKIIDYSSAINVIKELSSFDVDMSTDSYNVIINHINRTEVIPIIIEIMKENNIEFNVETYIYFLEKLIITEKVNKYSYILEQIESTFDINEHKRLIEAYKTKSFYWGGMGKVAIAKEILAKDMKKSIDKKDDYLNQTYQLGIISGLIDNNNNFDKSRKHILNMQEEFKEDLELYKYDIKNLEGQIIGVDKSEKIYRDAYEKEIPLKIIAYIESEKVLENIESMAIGSYFYKSNLTNINRFNINNFNFTSCTQEFNEIVHAIDYDKYDVSVFIISDFDSKEFIERNQNAEQGIDKLQELLVDKICNIRYVKMLDKPYCSKENIFEQMCKEHKI